MDNRVYKQALVGRLEADETELEQINRHTVRPFGPDELFTFKIALCDDRVDRDHERFTEESLEALAKLFVGKPVISGHDRKSAGQLARIYAAAVECGENGEKRLVAKCYMARCDGTRDLITEIEAGIKKEASVGCRVDAVRCSICGTDNRKMLCAHVGGRVYDGKVCHFTLEEPADAYEVSFVAVPAQPRAGVVKQYGGAPPRDTEKALLAERLRASEIDLFIRRNAT